MAKGSAVAIDIDVSRRLGDRILAARFTAGPGLTALFGPSGAGKTSILNMVAGLLRPDRGHIRIGDRTLFDGATDLRSEEHTSELQALMRISYAGFCLKKKKK